MNANLPRRAAMALFLHCSGSGPRQWQPITAALAGHVDCVAPTLIGYGEGESWRGGQPLTLDDEVDHLAEHGAGRVRQFRDGRPLGQQQPRGDARHAAVRREEVEQRQ